MIMLENFNILSNVQNQLYATIIANFVIISYGMFTGWLSPALPLLISEDTPLHTGPMTNADLSWIGGAVSIGAVVGTILFGVLSVKYGSKLAMTCCALPCIAFWILIYIGDTFYYVFFARLFGGVAGGAFLNVETYVHEIANNKIRNRLGSILPLAKNVGIAMSFIGGSYIPYGYRAMFFIVIPLIYLVWVTTLPNTPQHYLQKDKFLKAEKSIKYYNGCEGKSDHEKAIFKTEYQKFIANEQERRKRTKIELKDFQNRMALKGFATSFAMAWLMQTTGIVIIINYASLIFQECGTSLSVNASSIVLAIIQIVGGVVSTLLGDFRRKTTLYFSLSCSAFGLFIFTLYSYLRHSEYDVSHFLWLPVISLSFVIFTSSVGIVAISNACALENFSPKIRPIGVMFHSLCLNAVAFVGDIFFPISLEVVYLHGSMLILGINCCVGLICVAFMDETKGTSIDSVDPPENNAPVPKPSPMPSLSMRQHLRNKLSDHF
ncbi:facilitated trehalose transporter Tret1-like isoform X1 [Sitodiplosis mosellana]|uniref:facilitated trehalose transporter Tret1-like isoform X1 n=1 Tax=Sitodiplosis mosellana TaxID=263140 RepID=UPI00244456A7|nr:facilitated trehalose transporter Tret1-like isoform X1 [Sitodiplosis mosellana]